MLAAALLASGCGGGGGGGSAAPAPAGADRKTGTVRGRILASLSETGTEGAARRADLRIPLEAAEVACSGKSSVTDRNGSFTITGVPEGVQNCGVSKEGWLGAAFTVEVRAGESVEVTPEGPVPREYGRLEIISEPDGVPLSIDGTAVPGAETNIVFGRVIEGEHAVAIISGLYEDAATQAVTVKSGATATVRFELHRKIETISVRWDGGTLLVGETGKLTAECGYAGGAVEDCTEDVSWASSDGGTAGVSAGGEIVGIAPGQVTVSATREESRITFPGLRISVACPGGLSWRGGSCEADTLEKIEVSPAELELEAGGYAELVAECRWSLSGAAPCPALEWESDNEKVAEVTGGGRGGIVRAAGPGSALVRAAAGETKSNFAAVEVRDRGNPDPSCEGLGGFCVDVKGGRTGTDGLARVEVIVANPPPAGLGAGVATLAWTPGKAFLESIEENPAVLKLAENRAAPGSYTFVFSAAAPLSSGCTLFTMVFNAGLADAPVEISWNRDVSATNFTDFNFNLFSRTGINFAGGRLNNPPPAGEL